MGLDLVAVATGVCLGLNPSPASGYTTTWVAMGLSFLLSFTRSNETALLKTPGSFCAYRAEDKLIKRCGWVSLLLFSLSSHRWAAGC